MDNKKLHDKVDASRPAAEPKFGAGSIGLIAVGAIFVAALFIGFVIYGIVG